MKVYSNVEKIFEHFRRAHLAYCREEEEHYSRLKDPSKYGKTSIRVQREKLEIRKAANDSLWDLIADLKLSSEYFRWIERTGIDDTWYDVKKLRVWMEDCDQKLVLMVYNAEDKLLGKGRWYEDQILDFMEKWGTLYEEKDVLKFVIWE